MAKWMTEIGIGVLGVFIGLIPISGNLINSYTESRVKTAEIRAKVEMLEDGQKEILKAIDALRTDKRK